MKMSMQKNTDTTEKKQTSTLAQRVMQRISTEKVQPASKWWFICVECGIWIAWLSTVILGAIAIAVMLFVGTYARFALYEATHDRIIDFVTEILPTLWILLFVGMIILAYINIRHTKRGYVYSMTTVITSSILVSILGGVGLHFFKVGYLIDANITKIMPLYESYEEFEASMWQQPEDGRLLGRFRKQVIEGESPYVLTDVEQTTWRIYTSELSDADVELLLSGQQVRILGTTTNTEKNEFYACGVFPWLFGVDIDVRDMEKERRLFIGRMYTHMEASERVRGIEEETYGRRGEDVFAADGLCGEIAAVKRMHF